MIAGYKKWCVRLVYRCMDVVCIVLALYLACLLRPHTISFEVTLANIFLYPVNPFRSMFIFWMAITMISLSTRPLYETRREVLEGFEIIMLLRAITMSSLIVVVAIYVLKLTAFPRSILILGTGLMMLFLSIWRILKRLFVQYIVARGYNNFNALIIGAGKIGRNLAGEIHKRPGLGIKVVGFLDKSNVNVSVKPRRVLGDLEAFEYIARREFIHKIYITEAYESQTFVRLMEISRKLGIAVRVIPHGYELMSGELIKYNIGFIPVLEYCDADYGRPQMGKSLFDYMLVMSAMVFLIPIFLLLSFFIKLDSPGPIFYASKRYGRRGTIFNMLKFRSMRVDADAMLGQLAASNEVDGPIFKMKNDPRVTRMGRFLRKFSLDELPQLINVLKGEMSLVGPRPLPIKQIEKDDLKQLKRLDVRPGITGLWQIRGRSDISFFRLVKWDMWYIKNWSFWLDVSILLKTIPVVLKGKGAY